MSADYQNKRRERASGERLARAKKYVRSSFVSVHSVAITTIHAHCLRLNKNERPLGESEMHRMSAALVALTIATSAFAADNSSTTGAQNRVSTLSTRVLGYLTPETMPSSAALVPPPPIAGSAAVARDEEGNRQILELNGSPRWQLAAQDAVLTFPALAETFACALNASIDQERTPRLMTLLRRTLIDAGRSTSEAKKRYQRARPFMTNGKPICTPHREDALRADGSYPSGHSAIGYAFGLVLSELAPDQAEALVARGRQFGNSRLVCNVHWPSDVLEGQMMGAAVVARLHAEPEFRADMEAARAELAAVRTKEQAATRDCKIEQEALTAAH
jgi:acid phosphatase (class A)